MDEVNAIKKIVYVDELGRHTQLDLDASFDFSAWLNSLRAEVDELRTLAIATNTKLNSDAGVTDTDYTATVTATTPAALA